MGGIGRVAPAGKAVEQHLAFEGAFQPVLERRAERRQAGQAISLLDPIAIGFFGLKRSLD
jgi:hypothetical protein